MAKRLSSQKLLKNNVLDAQLCTGCGACVSLCPYQAIYNDRTVQLHYCDLTDGKCHAYCPRTPTDFESLRELLFDTKDLTPEIGAVKAYYLTRAADSEIRSVAQHGGTVTALMELALNEGMIDAAIVSSGNQEYLRYGTVAADKNTLCKNAGVKFTVSPMAAAFNQFTRHEKGNAGVVAAPCQALALAKMKLNQDKNEAKRINQLQFVIGLYCGWALSAEKFSELLAKKYIRMDAIRRMDIPAGKNILELHTANGIREIPLDEAQACTREACNYCIDSTAEYADVSVGAARFAGTTEEQRGWNQLIVRTRKGIELIDLAAKKGFLEIKDAPQESLRDLKKAALEKKKTALANITRKSGSAKNLLYLDNRDVLLRRILGV
ncbi:MAG: Coenzyme F420 hydrogenase/dehydrogenase, beta subunit C-terminal domain [Syntrophaceae bacterium]|nr:Coenzyme F420 hydrogenase/dehydrogenase, beta subunit C-terminal domain [Syntrophaceae bacterium]